MNIFGKKYHHLLIDVSDVSNTLEVVNKYINPCTVTAENCRWKKAPHCWVVGFNCRDKKWFMILKDLKTKNITLLPPYTGY